MIKSKLTTEAQTTIPQAVRQALHLGVGDEIAYRIEGDRVVLTRVSSGAPHDLLAMFSEWDGDADKSAYADL